MSRPSFEAGAMFSVWILETNTAVGDVCELQSRMIAEQEKRTELKRGGIAREAWTIAQLTSQIAVGRLASYSTWMQLMALLYC